MYGYHVIPEVSISVFLSICQLICFRRPLFYGDATTLNETRLMQKIYSELSIYNDFFSVLWLPLGLCIKTSHWIKMHFWIKLSAAQIYMLKYTYVVEDSLRLGPFRKTGRRSQMQTQSKIYSSIYLSLHWLQKQCVQSLEEPVAVPTPQYRTCTLISQEPR